jgi:hypothetical protein
LKKLPPVQRKEIDPAKALSGGGVEQTLNRELLLAPVRQGMGTRPSPISSARHHVENLLTAWALGLASADTQLLDELVSGVDLRLDGPARDRPYESQEILDWFALSGEAGFQTIGGINLQIRDNTAYYTATYQTWTPAGSPLCTSVGTYVGMLRFGPQAWRWIQHCAYTWPVGSVQQTLLNAARLV